MSEHGKSSNPHGPDVADEIGRKAERKAKARREKNQGVLFGFGMFGLVGWSVAIPIGLGVALGQWLDRNYPTTISWTLACLGIGIVLGCMNAWHWIKQESRHD